MRNCPESWKQRLEEGFQQCREIVDNIEQWDTTDETAQRHVQDSMDHILNCKFPLQPDQRVLLARVAYKAFMSSKDFILQLRWARSIQALLARAEPLPDLELPWRPAYELLRRACIDGSSCEPVDMSSGIGVTYLRYVLRFVRTISMYFPKRASEEILRELDPSMSPGDHTFILHLYLLYLFLPFNHTDQIVKWVPSIMKYWALLDLHEEVDSMCAALIAEAVKYAPDAVDWDAYSPRMFSKFMDSLDLDVNRQKNPLPLHIAPSHLRMLIAHGINTHEMSLSRSMGTFLVGSLFEGTSTLNHAKKMFHSLSTFFHPSNQGRWSANLGRFVSSLSQELCIRVGRTARSELMCSAVFSQDEELVKAMLPLLTQGMYSKNGELSRSCCEAYKMFADLYPELILPQLLESAYEALECVTESQRTLSNLLLLVEVVQHVFQSSRFSQGAVHMRRLLFSCLPAIDANDRKKTTYGLYFYCKIFTNVALVDARETSKSNVAADDMQMDVDMEDDDARHETFCFEEFAVAFTDRLLGLLEHQDDMGKGDVQFARQIEWTARCFFCCLSKSIYLKCAKRVVKFVCSNQIPAARDYLFSVLSSMCFANPEECIKMTVPLFLGKLVKKEGGVPHLQGSSQWQVWFSYMLHSALTYAGEHLTPFFDSFKSFIKLATCSTHPDVRNHANSCIHTTLHSMLSVYSSEARPFSASEWSESVDKPWAHWKRWFEFATPMIEHLHQTKADEQLMDEELYGDLEIEWHEPTLKEYDMAQSLVDFVLGQPGMGLMAVFNRCFEGGNASFDKEEVEHALETLQALTDGCAWALGHFGGDEVLAAPREDLPPMPRVQFSHVLTVEGTPMRSFIGRLINRLFSVFATVTTSEGEGNGSFNVTVLSVLVKISTKLLSLRPLTVSNVSTYANTLASFRGLFNDTRNRFPCYSRSELVEWANCRFFRRCLGRLANTAEAQSIVSDLLRVSVCDFPKVRDAAVAALKSNANMFESAVAMLDTCEKVLADGESSEQQCLGALSLLKTVIGFRILMGTPSLYVRVIKTLWSSMQHTHDKVQSATHVNFLMLFRMIYDLPAEHEGDSCVQQIQELSHWLTDLLKRGDSSFVMVDSQQGSVQQQEPLHWRYVLMTHAILFYTLRMDTSPSKDVVLSFVNGCFDELMPLRRMSFMTATVALSTFCGVRKQTAFRNSVFFQDNICHWDPTVQSPYRAPADYCRRSKVALDADTVASVEKAVLDNLPALVDALVNDHPTLQRSSADGSRASVARSALRSMGMGQGTSLDLLSLVGTRSAYPYGVFPVTQDFSVYHCRFIRAVLRVCSREVADRLLEAAAELLQQGDREKHCTGLEILAGLVRSSYEWPEAEHNSLIEKISPIMHRTLVDCAQESISDCMTCIRFMVYNVDTARLQWLSEGIVSRATQRETVQSLTPFKRLRFAVALLCDTVWRGADWAQDMISAVDVGEGSKQSTDGLPAAHPFKNCREQVARLLVMAHRASFKLDNNGDFDITHSSVPGAWTILSQISAKLKEMKDQESSSKEYQLLLETMSLFAAGSNLGGMACVLASKTVCIPHVISGAAHSDEHTSALAKRAASVLAWTACVDPAQFDAMWKAIKATSDGASWREQLAVLDFLIVFLPRHAFLMSDSQVKASFRLSTNLLQHEHQDVRQAASRVLAALLHANPAGERVKKLIKKCLRLSRTQLPKKNAKAEPASVSAVAQRHGGVLGLSALVRSAPYDVPEWMPAVLSSLTDNVSDPLPIGPALKKVFADFRASHHDQWHVHKEKFSEEELERVVAVSGSQSYFA